MSNIGDSNAVPKTEPYEEDEFSDSDQEPDGQNNAQEPAQVQKRKGGRKPVSALLPTCQLTLTLSDICYIGGKEAEESSGSGCLPRTTNRIYKAVGDYNQAS